MGGGHMIRLACLASVLALGAGAALAQRSIPNPLDTPGAVNPAVTQQNIGETICLPGWARTVRPPREYTSALKRRQLAAWVAYADGPLRAFEEDHLIPLELGGAPTDQRNLWPEPREPADGWGADRKDDLERVLHGLVCAGRLPLALAQRSIARDWIASYRQFVLESERVR
jgi:hypothetical protein